MTLRLLGIQIERKTDILAFTAFLLSVSTLIFQGILVIQGPDVTLFPSAQIILYSHKYPDTHKEYVTIISTMTYVNRAPSGKNGVVSAEKVKFSINNRVYEQTWHQFVFVSTDSQQRQNLLVNERASAAPFVVNAGSAEAHDTWFAPTTDIDCAFRGQECDVDKDFLASTTFVQAFEDLLLEGEDRTTRVLEFTLEARTLEDGEKRQECQTRLTARYLRQFRQNGWTVLYCRPM